MSKQDVVFGKTLLQILELIVNQKCWACGEEGFQVCVEAEEKKDEGEVEYFCDNCLSYAKLIVSRMELECGDDAFTIERSKEGLVVTRREIK